MRTPSAGEGRGGIEPLRPPTLVSTFGADLAPAAERKYVAGGLHSLCGVKERG
jgi:hypothetical protein